MTDEEESPSSLADLEALAGLDAVSTSESEDDALEAEAGDFDLAGLAKSTGAVASEVEPIAAPVEPIVAPVAAVAVPISASQASAANRPWGFVGGLFAGAIVAAVVAVAVVRMTSGPNMESAMPVPMQPAPALTPAATSEVAPVVSAPARIEQRPVVEPAVAAPSVVEPGASAARPAARPAPVRPQASSTAPTPSEDPTRPPAPAPTPEAPPPSRPIDSLLDDALGSGTVKRPKTADNLMGADLPLTPTAAEVTQVVQVLLPALRGCAMGESGVANTLLVVRNDGAVATASITGAPYAGAASGRCMEGVLRRAKFSRFRQSVFRVQFPLSIRASAP